LRQKFAVFTTPRAVPLTAFPATTAVTTTPLPVPFATFFAVFAVELAELFACLPIIDLLLFRRDGVLCDETYDGRDALQVTPRAVMKPTEHDPEPERRVFADPGNPDHVQG